MGHTVAMRPQVVAHRGASFDNAERTLVEALADFGWTGADSPVRVMSFSYVALQRMQRLAPDLRLVMLIEKARHWRVLKPVLEDGWLLGPGITSLTKHPKFADKL